jgi:hypothetical protein
MFLFIPYGITNYIFKISFQDFYEKKQVWFKSLSMSIWTLFAIIKYKLYQDFDVHSLIYSTQHSDYLNSFLFFYLLNDLRNNNTRDYIIHHSNCLIGMFLVYFLNYGKLYISCIIENEISTIPLALYKITHIGIFKYLFFIFFSYFRIFKLTKLTIKLFNFQDQAFAFVLLKIFHTIHLLINLKWYIQLIQLAYKRKDK